MAIVNLQEPKWRSRARVAALWAWVYLTRPFIRISAEHLYSSRFVVPPGYGFVRRAPMMMADDFAWIPLNLLARTWLTAYYSARAGCSPAWWENELRRAELDGYSRGVERGISVAKEF